MNGKPVFGKPIEKSNPVPAPRPREWSHLDQGRIGWSWESRDWLAEPNDGRPKKLGFVRKSEAIKYLEG